MFSTAQWIFAAVFAIVFGVVVFYSYKKDKKLHARNYKGVLWVGVVFVAFIILLFLIKLLLRK